MSWPPHASITPFPEAAGFHAWAQNPYSALPFVSWPGRARTGVHTHQLRFLSLRLSKDIPGVSGAWLSHTQP